MATFNYHSNSGESITPPTYILPNGGTSVDGTTANILLPGQMRVSLDSKYLPDEPDYVLIYDEKDGKKPNYRKAFLRKIEQEENLKLSSTYLRDLTEKVVHFLIIKLRYTKVTY